MRFVLLAVPVLILMAYSPVGAKTVEQETLKIVIGIPGKTGCLVCHKDPNIVKIENGRPVSLYVDEKWFEKTHKELTCIDCHIDFTYETIKPSADNWRIIAGTSCKHCHDKKKKIDHRKNYEDYRESVHGKKLLLEANEESPTCAGCHGNHRIRRLSDPAEMMMFRKEAYQICGRCHKKYWNNYNDWFHGKGYKQGAPDAPPCWDCHTAHKILPSKDPASPTNITRVAEQCEKCHRGSKRAIADYAKYIHKRNDLIKENMIMGYLFKALDYFKQGYSFIYGYIKNSVS